MGFMILGMLFWHIGIISALLLFLAPVVTFKKIISSKSTQEFSGIPYTLILLNCLLNMWYCLFSIRDDYFLFNLVIFSMNVFGAALALVYVIIFLIYAPKMEKRKIGAILAVVLSLFGTVALLSVSVFVGIWPGRIFCGFAVALSALAMYASPLSVMRMVIKTKSTEFMPFFLSLFMFLYATSWFIFGLFEIDLFLAVPSALGSVLGIVQLIVYARYRNNTTEKVGALDLKFSTGALDIEKQDNFKKQPDLELSAHRPY